MVSISFTPFSENGGQKYINLELFFTVFLIILLIVGASSIFFLKYSILSKLFFNPKYIVLASYFFNNSFKSTAHVL